VTEARDPTPVLASPVRMIPTDSGEEPETGVALCLSGGGYRAMLFHLGVIWRLREAGWLERLDRVSSVSGGSITAAVLALAPAGDFEEGVVRPLRALARRTLDWTSVLEGALRPGSISERLADAYGEHLFGTAVLGDLPSRPDFVINATNVSSGALARFERTGVRDWRVGSLPDPEIPVATAVACSSAFPPLLSPHRLRPMVDWMDEDGNDLTTVEHRDELVLSDGGVYDNLGLETAWKRCRTLIVSDAGGLMAPEARSEGDWLRHMARVLRVVDHQVRTLRKRQVIEGMKRRDRDGVYVGIRSNIDEYGLPGALPAPFERTLALAEIPTRLDGLPDELQERLINWGYAVGDAGLRKHLDEAAAPPAGFPYPDAGV
jgi:predicted acylesterase/phospholipase RssA